jgi:DNA-binding ferritin-like protein
MKEMKLKFKNEPIKLGEKKVAPMLKSASPVDAMVASCVTELMNAATSFHKLHLKVTGPGSYAAHKALQGYEKFHDFADDIAEQYQGATQTILKYQEPSSRILENIDDAIWYLKDLKDMITKLQESLSFSEIVNELDTLKSHINSMLYKLKFLS